MTERRGGSAARSCRPHPVGRRRGAWGCARAGSAADEVHTERRSCTARASPRRSASRRRPAPRSPRRGARGQPEHLGPDLTRPRSSHWSYSSSVISASRDGCRGQAVRSTLPRSVRGSSVIGTIAAGHHVRGSRSRSARRIARGGGRALSAWPTTWGDEPCRAGGATCRRRPRPRPRAGLGAPPRPRSARRVARTFTASSARRLDHDPSLGVESGEVSGPPGRQARPRCPV